MINNTPRAYGHLYDNVIILMVVMFCPTHFFARNVFAFSVLPFLDDLDTWYNRYK